MSEKETNIYKIGRKRSLMTQEEASRFLHIDKSTLARFENGNNIPNPDLVKQMSVLYNVPHLQIWHIKKNTSLGELIPDILELNRFNDLWTFTEFANDEIYSANKVIKESIFNETKCNLENFAIRIDKALSKLFSVSIFLQKIKKDTALAAQVSEKQNNNDILS